MFFETTYNDGLGETKASILARGCVKVRRGVFRCPDGSEITPSDEVAGGGGSGGGSGSGGDGGGGSTGGGSGQPPAPGEIWCLDPCTQERYEASAYDHTKGPGGGVCPRKVPAGGCPPSAKGPTTGGGSGGGGGGSTGGDMLEPIGGDDSPLSFLAQSIGGIPIWAIGVGAVLLLPILKGSRR